MAATICDRCPQNWQDFNTIIFNGFNFTLSDEIVHKINELASQVGSPTYIKTPVFQKKDRSAESVSPASNPKRRRDATKYNNYPSHDHDKIFNATKLVHKTGLAGDIDLIRSYLNKITDRTFVDMKTNIIELLDKLNHITQNGYDVKTEKNKATKLTLGLGDFSKNEFYLNYSTNIDYINNNTTKMY